MSIIRKKFCGPCILDLVAVCRVGWFYGILQRSKRVFYLRKRRENILPGNLQDNGRRRHGTNAGEPSMYKKSSQRKEHLPNEM
ncbi:hypothetical protein SUGI_0050990 [Cryptomeria japonica]|nr:hypothetical protein SUGI_0050990 [Cryptomeria japonica]